MLVEQNNKYLITFTSRTGSILVSTEFVKKFLLNIIQQYDESISIKWFKIYVSASNEINVSLFLVNEIIDPEYILNLRKRIKKIIEESFYLGTKAVLVGFEKHAK